MASVLNGVQTQTHLVLVRDIAPLLLQASALWTASPRLNPLFCSAPPLSPLLLAPPPLPLPPPATQERWESAPPLSRHLYRAAAPPQATSAASLSPKGQRSEIIQTLGTSSA